LTTGGRKFLKSGGPISVLLSVAIDGSPYSKRVLSYVDPGRPSGGGPPI
jgi:hypothetical protein